MRDDLLTVLDGMDRGIQTQLKIMRRPEAYGVSNEGVAFHVLLGIALALDCARKDLRARANQEPTQ